MSAAERRVSAGRDRPTQKLATPTETSTPKRKCSACGKEFTVDGYLDHVYDDDACYRVYLAAEKKEMSKQ